MKRTFLLLLLIPKLRSQVVKKVYKWKKIISYIWWSNEIIYKKYGLYDNNKQPIAHYLEQTYQDIITFQNEHPNKNILIHCFMGASRSASILTHYIYKRYKLNINDSIIFIKNQLFSSAKKKKIFKN